MPLLGGGKGGLRRDGSSKFAAVVDCHRKVALGLAGFDMSVFKRLRLVFCGLLDALAW